MPSKEKSSNEIAEQRIEAARRSNARELDLSDLELAKLPEALGQLTQLQHLDVSVNRLTALPEALGQLTQLQHLDGSVNQLTALPEALGQLTQLQHLYVFVNRLTALPEALGQLARLQHLAVSVNPLTALPEALGQLTQLQHLAVSDNQLTALPEALGQLTQLQHLAVSDNQLTALPKSLRQLKNLKGLYLHANPVLGLPPEVLGPDIRRVRSNKEKPANPAEILEYYFRTRGGSRPLNEAKLILVGYGQAGKTCLIKRMLYNTFNQQEPETPGIEIQPWQVKVPSGDDVRLHVWDFGGQEILHATHQFFLTERTVYLLVLNGRTGQGDRATLDAEYWLQLIRSFGGNSRVIVALNKWRQNPFDVNRGLLLEKYPFIADIVKTECDEPKFGLGELKDAILRETDALEHRKVKFPAGWFAIKERLAKMSEKDENVVTWEAYQKICGNLGEHDPQAQRNLAKFLHILGIALNYADDPRLRDTHVLNPRWVTEGIYTLLRVGQKGNRAGVLARTDLAAVLDSRNYPADCYDFLLRLMEKFQLCFELRAGSGRYLVPELLGENQPDEIRSLLDQPALGFRYQYEVLPEGLLPRFIVQTHSHSEANPSLRWRTGVVLEREDCRAVVRADARERRVDIHIIGPERQRRDLLAVIREKFEEQHRDLKGLTVQERVPVPGEKDATGKDITVSYQDLLQREHDEEADYRPEGARNRVNVADLLNGLEAPAARARRKDKNPQGQMREVINVYGPATIRTGDKHMENIGGDKNQLNISGGTFTNAPVAIKNELQNSYNTIEQAGDPGLKANLEQLHALVAQLMEKLDRPKALEVKENLEVLAKEVTKPEPRKKWYELSKDGLIEAAKTVKELAGPITSVLMEIGKSVH